MVQSTGSERHLYPRDTLKKNGIASRRKELQALQALYGCASKLQMIVIVSDHISKKVLIYDEAGFSRVCSAILSNEGYGTDIVNEQDDMQKLLSKDEVGVFVTSYPYGAFVLDEVRKHSLSAIVLFDNLEEQFVDMVLANENLYCMIKPLDYNKFKGLVRSLLTGEQVSREKYGIV
jgi:DNA-binding NtrC family response regulator